jgi:hypothetical protein
MSGHPKPAATVQFDSFVAISVEWLRGQGSGLCPLFIETDDAVKGVVCQSRIVCTSYVLRIPLRGVFRRGHRNYRSSEVVNNPARRGSAQIPDEFLSLRFDQ